MTDKQIESSEDHYDDYLRYSQECFGISWTPGNPCDVCDNKKECSEKYLSTHPTDDSLEARALKTRWKKLNLPELLGADYALRMALTSVVFRGEAKKQLIDLTNEVRKEINARPDECMRQSQPGFYIRIINCESCPFKEYGIRKCSITNWWFDDFEIETGIPSWCQMLDGEKK